MFNYNMGNLGKTKTGIRDKYDVRNNPEWKYEIGTHVWWTIKFSLSNVIYKKDMPIACIK